MHREFDLRLMLILISIESSTGTSIPPAIPGLYNCFCFILCLTDLPTPLSLAMHKWLHMRWTASNVTIYIQQRSGSAITWILARQPKPKKQVARLDLEGILSDLLYRHISKVWSEERLVHAISLSPANRRPVCFRVASINHPRCATHLRAWGRPCCRRDPPRYVVPGCTAGK